MSTPPSSIPLPRVHFPDEPRDGGGLSTTCFLSRSCSTIASRGNKSQRCSMGKDADKFSDWLWDTGPARTFPGFEEEISGCDGSDVLVLPIPCDDTTSLRDRHPVRS